MNERLYLLCFSFAVLLIAQIQAVGQELIIQPFPHGKSCVILQTGTPSKLVEAIHKNEFEKFRELIAAGEDLNAFDHDYETPLMAAVSDKRIEFVRELIEAGADVNKANSIGWTPLIWAAQRNRADIAKILLDAGATVDAENQDGTTALLIAAREGSLELFELLLEAGANLYHKNKQEKTALLLSAEGGQPEILKKLLSLGFDPNSNSYGGYTALIAAARYPELLRILLSAGAKVNFQISVGGGKNMTALEVAAQNGWTESVKVLIEAGADPNLFHSPGRLPLDKAIKKTTPK